MTKEERKNNFEHLCDRFFEMIFLIFIFLAGFYTEELINYKALANVSEVIFIYLFVVIISVNALSRFVNRNKPNNQAHHQDLLQKEIKLFRIGIYFFFLIILSSSLIPGVNHPQKSIFQSIAEWVGFIGIIATISYPCLKISSLILSRTKINAISSLLILIGLMLYQVFDLYFSMVAVFVVGEIVGHKKIVDFVLSGIKNVKHLPS